MNNPGFKRGLFFGGCAIALFLLAYLVNKRMIFSPGFGPLVTFVLPIVFMVFAAKDLRSDQEGFMSFGESLSVTFLTYVVGSFLYSMFNYVMTNIVDPSLLEIAREVALDAIDKLSGFFGEDQIDDMKERIEEGTENSGSIMSALLGWAITLIFPGFIMALIISAIMKRNQVA